MMKTFYDRFLFDASNRIDLYRLMFFIRKFEEKLLDQFGAGNISGTTHTCIGQEADAAGILTSLNRDIDTVWSNHRCHGHFLAYCGNAFGLFSEILAKKSGVCGGRGGSQHLAYHNFFSSGIQGGLAPLAVGTAWADKNKGAISVSFLGDGTMGEGNVYEALNMASLWSCPVLFVVEDNGIAQTTDKHLGVAGEIAQRAAGFGIESRSIKSTNVFEIRDHAIKAISYVRMEKRPFWLHIETTRLMAHSKSDDTRDPAVVAKMGMSDCLLQIAPEDAAIKSRIEAEVEVYLNEAFFAALQGEDACG